MREQTLQTIAIKVKSSTDLDIAKDHFKLQKDEINYIQDYRKYLKFKDKFKSFQDYKEFVYKSDNKTEIEEKRVKEEENKLVNNFKSFVCGKKVENMSFDQKLDENKRVIGVKNIKGYMSKNKNYVATCIHCGRPLTADKSINDGMGHTCKKKFTMEEKQLNNVYNTLEKTIDKINNSDIDNKENKIYLLRSTFINFIARFNNKKLDKLKDRYIASNINKMAYLNSSKVNSDKEIMYFARTVQNRNEKLLRHFYL